MTIDLSQYKHNITSQFGENGIIAKIFETIGPRTRKCVEFGGFNLKNLSNIYPLWTDEGWTGLMIEGDSARADQIRKDYEALAASGAVKGSLNVVTAYVGSEGDNALDAILARTDMADADLVSIDVDGLDYHIWQALSKARPRVIVIEFNPTVPPHLSLKPSDNGVCIGAGIKDMCELGNAKGYDLVAATDANAFFVLKEEAAPFANKNDLDKLFVPSHLTYAISTFDGGLVLSKQPNFGFRLSSPAVRHIANGDSFWHVPPLSSLLVKDYGKTMLKKLMGRP